MSDPFSVAGGAAGIISLGIQLCKEITSYAAAWQDYDEHIQAVGMKAEELQSHLKRLRQIVEDTQLTDPGIARDLSENACNLQRLIAKIKKTLDQYKPVLRDGSIGKLRNKLKRATYPITGRDALRDIDGDIDASYYEERFSGDRPSAGVASIIL
ncbi:hypothetical protein BDV59DRAFT_202298 [Aspergillus ambiguus]|uniref:uncharacterized protein n=1 Tax=Aspergillus ambiguus TaxID=176160 RepID=UPI003CCE1E07